MNRQLVVLAAGMGSRFGGVKQVARVTADGRTLPEIAAADAADAGYEGVVFVIRRDIEKDFREVVGEPVSKILDTRYVFQEMDACVTTPPAITREKPWGTGHALLCARKAVESPCVVINADDYYGSAAYRIAAEFLDKAAPKPATGCDCCGCGCNQAAPAHFALVGFRLDNTLSESGEVSRGICTVADDGLLTGVEEHTGIAADADGHVTGLNGAGRRVTIPGDCPVSLNFWAFTPAIFEMLQGEFDAFLAGPGRENPKAEFYLPAGVNAQVAADKARVQLLTTPEKWCGMTYAADLEDLRRRLAARGF